MSITETASSGMIDNGADNGALVGPAPGRGMAGTYRSRAVANLLRMGHCAPTVMQTILGEADTRKEWLVKLTAGLPGGIGNTGFECGGVTAPLVLLGLSHGLAETHDGLPHLFYKGHEYYRRFLSCNNTLLCKDIRNGRRLPTPCIGVIRHAPGLYIQTVQSDSFASISGEKREAFRSLYAHMGASGFHCSHAVLQHVRHLIPLNQELLDATSGFLGGTLFEGLTCSALAAGIMAVGLKIGEIENSRLRVMRMIATMLAGGNAFSDRINKFNKIMNIGNRMAEWFTREFGSTLCNNITKCDFSKRADVKKYMEKDSVAGCRVIAEKVAREVESIAGTLS